MQKTVIAYIKRPVPETSTLFDPVTIMTEELLITNCTLLPQSHSELLAGQYVLIRNGRIINTGEMTPGYEAVQTIDAGGNLVMPGLINGHNHCGMTLFRGMADDLRVDTWLYDKIFPAEAAHVDPHMVYWCTKLAAAEMILSGTTTIADCYLFSDQAARALDDSGMRGVVAHGVIDHPTPSVADPGRNIEAVSSFIDNSINYSSRITPAVFAHAPYTCSPATLKRAKHEADSHNLRLFIHLAESKDEHETVIDPQGTTPVQHLMQLGILDSNTTCVHAVWLADTDIEILADSGATVVTCPQSNLKLASGIAPVQQLLDRSISVGLGTDGCASNNSLDLFREMDMLAKIQKTRYQLPTVMTSSDVLCCATIAGAKAIGLQDVGVVKPGAHADLIIIDTNAAHLCPLYNKDLLVYAASGSDVESVIIDGKIVMQNRQIRSFNIEEVYGEIDRLILPT